MHEHAFHRSESPARAPRRVARGESAMPIFVVCSVAALLGCDPGRFHRASGESSAMDASDEPADAGRPHADGGHDSEMPSTPRAVAVRDAGRPTDHADASARDASTGGGGAGGYSAGTGGKGGGSGAAAAGSSAPPATASTDVPSDAILWLAADVGATVMPDGVVSAWASRAPNGYTARSALTESAPKLVRDDHGRPWIDFDGADELLLPAMPPIGELSLFAVANARQPPGEWRCPSLLHFANRASGTVTQTARLEFGRHMTELLYQTEGVEITVPRGTGSFSPMVPHVLSVLHGADTIAKLRVDAKQIHAQVTALPPAIPRAFNYIGNNHYYADSTTTRCEPYDGQIAEIILFARGVSEDERDRIERYLAVKWGVPIE